MLEVTSALTGTVWVVDRADAACDEAGQLGWTRRLLFLRAIDGAVQSEVRLLPRQSRGGVAIDRTYLGSEAHAALIAGIVFADALDGSAGAAAEGLLIIGAGAGALTCFLLDHFPAARITAVERDPVVLCVAKRLLGLPGILPTACAAVHEGVVDAGLECSCSAALEEADVELVVADGASFVLERAAVRAKDARWCAGAAEQVPAPFAAIVVDVDDEAKFCEAEFLRAAASLLGERGALVLNVGARSATQLQASLRGIAATAAAEEDEGGEGEVVGPNLPLFAEVYAIPVAEGGESRHSAVVCCKSALGGALPLLLAQAEANATRFTAVQLALWLEAVERV